MMYGIATWARCSLRKRSCQRSAKSAWRRACQPLPGRSEFSRLAKMQQCSIALQQHASCSMQQQQYFRRQGAQRVESFAAGASTCASACWVMQRRQFPLLVFLVLVLKVH